MSYLLPYQGKHYLPTISVIHMFENITTVWWLTALITVRSIALLDLDLSFLETWDEIKQQARFTPWAVCASTHLCSTLVQGIFSLLPMAKLLQECLGNHLHSFPSYNYLVFKKCTLLASVATMFMRVSCPLQRLSPFSLAAPPPPLRWQWRLNCPASNVASRRQCISSKR